MKQWNAAAYLRTSKSTQEDPGNTIQNQLSMIMDYIERHDDIELCSIKADNGYTGLNFDRPAYQEMMEDIKTRKINCNIVKDLSRFGRDHLKAGEYIERIFPFLGVRFIAINDHYDSLHHNQNSDGLLIPFKNLVNQMYSMDISQKTSSRLKLKREQGEFIGGNPVYGYKRSPDDRHQLVIDEPATSVVRDIFQWRLEGLSADRIALRLNQKGIPSPAGYKQKSGSAYSCHFQQKEAPVWFARSVIRILRNRVYTGTLEQGKSRSNPLC